MVQGQVQARRVLLWLPRIVARNASGNFELYTYGVAGAPVMGLVVLLAEADHLLLDNVAVDPVAQGQGVGRALIDFAAAEVRVVQVEVLVEPEVV